VSLSDYDSLLDGVAENDVMLEEVEV
jgi:hypothetical protein